MERRGIIVFSGGPVLNVFFFFVSCFSSLFIQRSDWNQILVYLLFESVHFSNRSAPTCHVRIIMLLTNFGPLKQREKQARPAPESLFVSHRNCTDSSTVFTERDWRNKTSKKLSWQKKMCTCSYCPDGSSMCLAQEWVETRHVFIHLTIDYDYWNLMEA